MTRAFDLDHVGLLVTDLDAARHAYERLGFKLTVRSSHEGRLKPGGPVETWGTGNHCAMFRQGYLELLGITDPSRHHDHVKEPLARYQGLQLIALGCRDADVVRGLWAKTVDDLPAVAEVGRAVPQFGGGTRPAGFRIVHLDGYIPEVKLFAIQQLNPEALWQPALLDQPNGVVALAGATVVSAEPQVTVRRLSALGLGGEASPGGWRVSLDRGGWIDVLSPAEAAKRFPGVKPPALPSAMAAAFKVADLAQTARCLAKAGVAAVESDGRIRVSAQDAQGCVIDFEAQGAEGDRR